jgi:hypothetical protein
MGDSAYLQFTIYDCPSRRARVAQLMADHLDTDHGLKVGEMYTNDGVAAGSIQSLADNLIAAAPRCSFLGWEDPCMTDDGPVLGELIAYCPRYGRFDGECTGNGDVVLDGRQVLALVDDAERRGWLDRDHALRWQSTSRTPGVIRVSPDQPGLREAIEVATAIPWKRDLAGERPARAKRLAWLAAIDARAAEQDRRLATALGKYSAAAEFGVDPAVLTECREVHAHTTACRIAPPAVAAIRATAGEIEAAIEAAAGEAGKRPHQMAHSDLPGLLRGWADIAESAWQGRRRP